MKQAHKHLLYGVLLTAGSFLYWQLPQRHSIVGLANAAFYMGQVFFFDFLSEQFSGFSLLKRDRHKKHFLILGLIFGLLLELYFNWLGKFWHYPYWNLIFYIIIFIPGFAVYAFYLLEVFLGSKAVLEHLFRKRWHKDSLKGVGWLYTVAGLLGVLVVSIATSIIITNLPPNGLSQALQINTLRQGSPDIWYWYFSVFIGIWLVLEYLEYKRHETSLLYEMYKKNYWPLLALLLGGIFSALLYETFNAPGGLWRYAYQNAPWPESHLFGFPLIVYIAWPFHLLPVISLYRLLYKKETQKLWE